MDPRRTYPLCIYAKSQYKCNKITKYGKLLVEGGWRINVTISLISSPDVKVTVQMHYNHYISENIVESMILVYWCFNMVEMEP